MNRDLCFRCRQAPRQEERTYCSACEQQAKQEADAREARNRTVSCDDCKAAIGQGCRTGSGVERPAHVSRERKAIRAAKGAA